MQKLAARELLGENKVAFAHGRLEAHQAVGQGGVSDLLAPDLDALDLAALLQPGREERLRRDLFDPNAL